jgi:hypothetical protein
MRDMKYTQVHVYIDNCVYPEIAKKVRLLKAKRKLNTLIVKLLNEHFKKGEEQQDLFQ